MLLDFPFVRLPFDFDASRLAEEVGRLDRAWLSHPTGVPGNTALLLVTVGGGMNDSFAAAGSFAPTPHLEACPYVQQIMAHLGCEISRSRFMRIDPGAKVPWHTDANYHWFCRARIHIPVVTSPEVTFRCSTWSAHFAAGECWTFNNMLPHSVDNNGGAPRVHLVIDVPDSSQFRALLARGTGTHSSVETATTKRAPLAFRPGVRPTIEFEQHEVRLPSGEQVTHLAKVVGTGLRGSTAPRDIIESCEAILARVVDGWRRALSEPRGVAPCQELLESIPSWLFDAVTEFTGEFSDATFAVRVLASVFKLDNTEVERPREPPGARSPQVSPQDWIIRDTQARVAMDADEPVVVVRETRTPLSWGAAEIVASLASPVRVDELFEEFAESFTPPEITDFMGGLVAHGVAHSVTNWLSAPLLVVGPPESGAEQLAALVASALDIPHVSSLASVSTLTAGNVESDVLEGDDAKPDATRSLLKALLPHAPRLLAAHSPMWSASDEKMALQLPFWRALVPAAKFLFIHRDPEVAISRLESRWAMGSRAQRRPLPSWKCPTWAGVLPADWQTVAAASGLEKSTVQWNRCSEAILAFIESDLPREAWQMVSLSALLQRPTEILHAIGSWLARPLQESNPPWESGSNSIFWGGVRECRAADDRTRALAKRLAHLSNDHPTTSGVAILLEGSGAPPHLRSEYSIYHQEFAPGKHAGAVGGDWEELGGLQIDFLKTQGLEPHHHLLDVGCGPLRAGRLFVAYLESGHYCGLDINRSLLEAGMAVLREAHLMARTPRLLHTGGFEVELFEQAFDFAFAHSLFTHIPLHEIAICLRKVARRLKAGGRFFATFYRARDSIHLESIHHGTTTFEVWSHWSRPFYHQSLEELTFLASCAGLQTQLVGDWGHPRFQQMVMFTGADRAVS